MPLIITDQMLCELGMSEREARIEIACRLFDGQKLAMPDAARFAGLSRLDFEQALIDRDLPLIRYTEDHLRQDVSALEGWRRDDADRGQRHVSDSGAGSPRSD